MKNILKKWWFWVIIIVIILLIVSSFGKKSDSGITRISTKTDSLSYTPIIYLSFDNEDSYKKNVSVLVDCDKEFSVDNLQFVTDDPKIATIEYTETTDYNGDESSYEYEVWFDVIGVSAGDTTFHVQTTDGIVVSNETTVKVTGDPAILKNKQIAKEESEKLQALEGGSLTDAMSTVEKLGYTATYTHDISRLDFTEEITAFDDEELSKWVIVSVEKINNDKKTVEFRINTTENINAAKEEAEMRKALSEKLDRFDAWKAVKSYGETQYPYGFELHYLANGKETPKDENTWFLKASVTVTNMYNAKSEMTCEAYVTGTSNNPEIVEFNVY